MIDYHIHTRLCGHAVGEPEEYIKNAIKLGINDLGFSDHFPLIYQPKFSYPIRQITMKETDIDLYLNMITKLQKKYSEIDIKIGFEVDYFEKENLFFNKYSALYYELDYTIGAIHFLNEWGFDQSKYKHKLKEITLKDMWKDYLNLITKMIKRYRKYIDIIAHIDIPKRYNWPMPQKIKPELSKLLGLIKENELIIEVNTSGFDHPINEQYPSDIILKEIKRKKIKITIGSDAHSPNQIGRYFNLMIDKLKSLGFTRLIKLKKNHKLDYFSLL